jgi:predicted RNA-binding Zn ribbon-like protein
MGDVDTTLPPVRVTAQLRELRFDAGSPSLNLLATIGRRPSAGIERLTDVTRLKTWADGIGYPLADGEATAEALAGLRRLREDVFAVVTDAMAGRPISPAAVNVAAGSVAPQLASSLHELRWTASELTALLARDAVDVLLDPARRGRLRACDSPVCRMIFLDGAGGRPRRWCSMSRCGNTSKAAAYRNRAH